MLSKLLAAALLVVGISAWPGNAGLAQVSASHVDDKGEMLAQVNEPMIMAELLGEWTWSKSWPTRGLRDVLSSPSKPCRKGGLNHSQISLILATQETHNQHWWLCLKQTLVAGSDLHLDGALGLIIYGTIYLHTNSAISPKIEKSIKISFC